MRSMMSKARILVIGAGVSGLTTALCLRQKGLQVTVVAEQFAPQIVSIVAGALWEWPPAVCGFHQDQRSLERSKQWCMASYEKFFDLSTDERTGVFIRPVTFYFRYEVLSTPYARHKMEEIRDHVKGFRHDPAMIAEHQINPNLGLKDAYRHLAPMVDTDAYMQWLLVQVLQAGCTVLNEHIDGDLREQEQALKRRFGVEAIVNCSGLGARELAKDDIYPLRGALIHIKNDGSSMPRITEAHCVPHETGDEQDLVFIVPRGKDKLILGGLTEPHEWSKDISLENYRPIQDMLDRCVEFLPILKQAQFDPLETVRVGLRPMRNENVRLEQEPGTQIIHNYGHGGSGVTFSWGCAEEVAEIMEALLDRAALSIPPHIKTGTSTLVQETGYHKERRFISNKVKLTRYEPFDELVSLRDAKNRLFEDSFVSSDPFDLSTKGRTFPVDSYETDKHYTIEAVLLGVKPEDIQITALGDTLTIHVMQKYETKNETKNSMRRECYEKEVSRTIGFPGVVEPEKVEATYEHGILKIQVPKAEVAKPKPISLSIKEVAGTHA